ncbi:hypothetical protein B2J93_546 [Marssonina coronariae]|uniref:Uncharacterized protein n=1 Tax=Diplocarpon coronariae TaxID=2795749 RepID=A0A218YXY5_9HELO|nr:hypothetical protein B2J93_546 [Marssonina coronariae]
MGLFRAGWDSRVVHRQGVSAGGGLRGAGEKKGTGEESRPRRKGWGIDRSVVIFAYRSSVVGRCGIHSALRDRVERYAAKARDRRPRKRSACSSAAGPRGQQDTLESIRRSGFKVEAAAAAARARSRPSPPGLPRLLPEPRPSIIPRLAPGSGDARFDAALCCAVRPTRTSTSSARPGPSAHVPVDVHVHVHIREGYRAYSGRKRRDKTARKPTQLAGCRADADADASLIFPPPRIGRPAAAPDAPRPHPTAVPLIEASLVRKSQPSPQSPPPPPFAEPLEVVPRALPIPRPDLDAHQEPGLCPSLRPLEMLFRSTGADARGLLLRGAVREEGGMGQGIEPVRSDVYCSMLWN